VTAYVKIIVLNDLFEYNTVEPLLDPTLLSVGTMIEMYLLLQRQQFMKLFDKLSPGKSANSAYRRAHKLTNWKRNIDKWHNGKNPKYCKREVAIWLASAYSTPAPPTNTICPCCHR
jgi:hypothetical protein